MPVRACQRRAGCYFITQWLKLLYPLMAVALMLTNSAAVASAMCQHGDAQAHEESRLSSDRAVAAVAISEEAAAEAATKSGALADAASVQFAGFLIPGSAAVYIKVGQRIFGR